MLQAIRQPLLMIQVISFGFATAILSLLQPIPSVSAQQLTAPVSQEISGTGAQAWRIENMAPTSPYPSKSLEKKDARTSTRKLHRLIRKPQNAPVASVNSSSSGSSPISALPTPPPSLPSDNTTPQSKEPLSLNRSVGGAVPLATIGVAPSSAPATGSTAAATAPTGAIPLAAASAANSPTSRDGGGGGRTMRRLAAEMPGLAQLTSPPSVPVLSVNPAIGASPASLSFTAQQGGGNPTAQTLTISNAGGGTLSWSASESAAWLSLSPASGTGNGAVTASVATGTLTAGSYSGTITLSAPGTASVTIPVALTVTAAPIPPAIGVSPTSLSFTAQQGGSNPPAQTLNINNRGGGTLTWSASDNTAWVSPSPTSGTGNGVLTISVTTGSLTAGTYTGVVTLSATGTASVTIPVALTITAAPVAPAIGMSPTSLSFTAKQGGGNPAPQTLNISNTGGGTLSWSVSNNAIWVSHSPTSGTGNGMVTIGVTTGSLTAGTYNGVVTLYASGATSVTVPVTFAVTAAPTINLSPSTLSYAATQGAANPANQNISLTNSGGTLNWTVSDDASWLAVSPASGSGSSTLPTSVNTAGLTAGTYSGTLTVSAAGTSSKTVAVTLTVSAPATSSATLTWNANTDSDLAGYKIYRATTSGGYGAPIATLPGNVTTYIAAGLQSGTTYFFVITSYDSTGNESPRSNEVSKSIF